MKNWTEIQIGDYIDIITDYHANGSYETLKNNITLKYEPDYAIMIRTLNFESNDWSNDLIYLNEKEYDFLSKSKVKPYDLIMNKIANPGTIYLMPDLDKPVSLAMNLFLIRFNKKLDQKFMYYLMKFHEEYIKRIANGTTTKTITKDDIKSLKFKIPDLTEQKKISSFLFDIQDKIDVLKKINNNLEKLVKNLYDFWFIQFDFPNKEGKPYKSSGGEMIWSPVLNREIPIGWKIIEISQILRKNNSKIDNPIEIFETLDLSVIPSSTFCLDQKSTSESFKTNLYYLKKFDILFGSIRPYLKKSGFSPIDGLVTGTVHSYTPKIMSDYNFALLTMSHENIFKFAVTNSKGTKMPVIDSDDLLSYKVAYNSDISKKFNEIIEFKETISNNIFQIQKLETFKNYISKVILNGQITIN